MHGGLSDGLVLSTGVHTGRADGELWRANDMAVHANQLSDQVHSTMSQDLHIEFAQGARGLHTQRWMDNVCHRCHKVSLSDLVFGL